MESSPHATISPDSSSSVAASRERVRALALAPRPSATWQALSAALARGNASHASALNASCQLSRRTWMRAS